MKTCRICDQEKEITEFALDKKSSDGHCSHCKKCQQVKDATRIRKYDYYQMKRNKLATLYGLSPIEAEKLFKAAGDCCQICGGRKQLQIDHSHQTGTVRGVLCHQCNSAIGMFKDSLENLIKATQYLRQAPTAFNFFAALNQLKGRHRI